ISKTQEEEVGDGTTTAVMLAGKLLENAEKLLDMKIHPSVITKGYALAAEKAQEFLMASSIAVNPEKESDQLLLKQNVYTAVTGKAAESVKEVFADIIVKAVQQVFENGAGDPRAITIVKNKSGGIESTRLVSGIVVDKARVSMDMPLQIRSAKIALVSESLEIKNISDAKISIHSPDQLQQFLDRDEIVLREMVDCIKKSGANVIFCQKGIDDILQYYLAQEQIYACRRVTKSDLENLSRATHAKIVSTIHELSEKELGIAGLVEEIKHGEEAFTYVQECKNPRALTIIIHGGSEHVMDEMERAIKDGIGDVAAVLKDKKIVVGAGAIEIELSKNLRAFSQTLAGREQLAVQEFANALEFIPLTLAENAGLDPIDVLTELKSHHDRGE
ncbi:MAG: thermosome subunit alpha, partial [Nanoarchaeota archaeon]